MSLETCKECSKEISSKADKCPYCGAPVKKKRFGCLGVILVLVVVCLISAALSNVAEFQSRLKQKRIDTKEIKQQQEIVDNELKKTRAFVDAIETHYQEVAELYKSSKYEAALEKIEMFEEYNQMGFKDIKQLYTEMSIDVLEKKVRKIPASKFYENLIIYKHLLALAPDNERYKKKVAHYSAIYDRTKKQAEKETEKKRLRDRADIELLSWTWRKGRNYVTAEGQVRNISGRKLERVQALVTWYDKNKNMVTSDTSLIEYDPLMPNQVSPFTVMERYNPEMRSASLEFKFMFGREIIVYRDKK